MTATKEKKQPRFKQITVMLMMTAFQLLSAACVLCRDEELNMNLVYIFFGYIAAEWLYMLIGNLVTDNDYFELEAIAFFLSGIGLTVCASFSESYALKQLIAIGMGLAVYLIMLLLIKDVHVAGILRYPAAVGSVAVLAANLVLAQTVNGTLNWIDLGFFSIQPSELVKITFILVGAVSLEKLLSITSLTKYVIFSLGCVGALFLMRDFGTALIFFFTFVLIAFMRSGNIRTIVLICTVALMGAMLIIYFKPYVANRFAAYRHVWDYIDTTGYQQTRVLIYSASGGLFGLGIGEGKLRDIYAASTDLVFGLICEEMGIILGIAVLLSFAGIAFFAIKSAKSSASTFYAIAAVGAAGMMLFQLSLNVFGITDLLPLTGVTLPFVSRGGSSMLCSWGLLAYIRAAGAPFKAPQPDIAVKKTPPKVKNIQIDKAPPKRKKGGSA
ncbi:MAG: FtsW/RodA/SpoVE family cell cycle protein [Clostridia bacterium]|nr:FtsW/RodA/SpoVE family cell cycle protein [Clostridia bacterium]